MLWTPDPNVEAARKLPDWRRFHRACGEQLLFFDHMEREGGKRGPYKCDAFTLTSERNGARQNLLLSTGRGKTVIAAIRDAYVGSGREIPEATALLARDLAGATVAAAIDFDDILGGNAPTIDFEDILG